jgi:hypothetical protein
MQSVESGPSRLFQTGARLYFRTRTKSRGKTESNDHRQRQTSTRSKPAGDDGRNRNRASPSRLRHPRACELLKPLALSLGQQLSTPASASNRAHLRLTPLDVLSRVHSTPPGLHTSAQTCVEHSGSLPQTHASPRRVAPSRTARNEHRSPRALLVIVYLMVMV